MVRSSDKSGELSSVTGFWELEKRGGSGYSASCGRPGLGCPHSRSLVGTYYGMDISTVLFTYSQSNVIPQYLLPFVSNVIS